MIGVILLFSVVSCAFASPFQSMALQDDGSYQFFYETGADAGNQMRRESRGSDGVVTGRYGYQDPTGEHRVVNYRADDFGYVAQGDVGVPGAPEGQFPAQPDEDDQPWANNAEENEQYDTDDDTSKTEEVPDSTGKKHETKKDTSKDADDDDHPSHDGAEVTVEDDDDEEDDVKPAKLPEPSDDAPPEGFPVGFFTHQFHNIRRLPEPKFEEVNQGTKSVNQGTRSANQDTRPANQDTRSANQDSRPVKQVKGSKSHTGPSTNVKTAGPVAVHHQPHHFGSYPYHGWAAAPFGYVPGVHHPAQSYVYSHPTGHGYYYFY